VLNFVDRLADHAAVSISNAQLYEQVKRANQAKSEFVSIVAHELKLPMTSIKGYSDLLAMGAVGQVTEGQLSFLNTIRSNVERMNTLVSDLLDISRIETGRLKLDIKRVALSASSKRRSARYASTSRTSNRRCGWTCLRVCPRSKVTSRV